MVEPIMKMWDISWEKTLKKKFKNSSYLYLYLYIYMEVLKGGNTWGCDRRASAATFFALIDVLVIW